MTSSYVNAGLIKNYDYDTLIIGSCMVGNYNMEQWRSRLGGEPLKAESGGMSPASIAAYMQKARHAKPQLKYYVNLDITGFNEDWSIGNEYLLKDDLLSKAKYLLGYETWFRFIPVDIGLILLKTVKGDFSGKFLQRTEIDYNGDWSIGAKFGEALVWEHYQKDHSVGCMLGEPLETAYERMTENIDRFISESAAGEDAVFIFPPYSALQWCEMEDSGQFETYIAAKRYLVERLNKNGCTIFDFQDSEMISNLDYYMDEVHYSPEVNEFMLDCFVNGENIITPKNFDEHCDNLVRIVEQFRLKYADRLVRE